MKACMPAFLAVLISASEQPLAQSLQLSQVKAGKLRALAVTGKTRVAAAPDVPTLAESGLSNYEFISWMGVAAPAGTPQPIIARLNAELARALKTPAA